MDIKYKIYLILIAAMILGMNSCRNTSSPLDQDDVENDLYIENIKSDLLFNDADNHIEVEGNVEAVNDGMITVSSVTFSVDSGTTVVNDNSSKFSLGDIQVGQFVEIEGHVENGENAADKIEIKEQDDNDKTETSTEGKIKALTDTEIIVNGLTFEINSATKIRNENNVLIDIAALEIGKQVGVSGYIENGINIAGSILLKS